MTRQALLAILLSMSAMATVVKAEPNLVLTQQGVNEIKRSEQFPKLFATAYEDALQRVERSLAEGVVVPMPKDPGGGYTHERHKENYKIVHDAGILYQLTGEQRYLQHAEAILFAYADIYNDLPLHPERKKQTPGRLFWQGLNEAVWLVHVIQGFDAIQDDLSEQSRIKIETELLRPVAEFLSTGSPQTFQRIHNHGTWAAAAVGMTGYALNDDGLVERALLGLEGDGSAGFLAQLDQLFSPDGYYTEGPYYQRYALMPFVLFGQAIQNNDPERKIFERRGGVLVKAITSTIQQSYAGKFFPINDAIKEKGLDTPEVVYGVAAAYALTGDPGLLSIAELQGTTVLTGDGFAVASASAEGLTDSFSYTSQVLSDGPKGQQGGLAILRMGDGPLAQTAVLKHTGQGMGHGHFDKLSLIWYDQGREILTDYGAARFLNVRSKDGGRYLPENNSFAKQTVAHNTIVLGQTSHHDGNWRRGQESWPTIDVFEAQAGLNVVSATIDDAYPDTKLRRTTLQVQRELKTAPLLIDVVDVDAAEPTTMDLPFYFDGQLTDSNLDIKRWGDALIPLGENNGYEHLWVEGRTREKSEQARFTWLADKRFYSYHSISSAGAEAFIVRSGANDPHFNLRSEQGIMLRLSNVSRARFVSVFEPHGVYDPAQEFTLQSDPNIRTISRISSEDAELIILVFNNGSEYVFGLADNPGEDIDHSIKHGGRTYSWRGFYQAFWE